MPKPPVQQLTIRSVTFANVPYNIVCENSILSLFFVECREGLGIYYAAISMPQCLPLNKVKFFAYLSCVVTTCFL